MQLRQNEWPGSVRGFITLEFDYAHRTGFEFDRYGLGNIYLCVVDRTFQRPFPDKSSSPAQKGHILSARLL
jgi:hypothetical protein